MKLKIEKLIFEGFGLGHNKSGKPVFVRKAVPEDDLEVKILKDKKNHTEAKIEKIIKPSHFRVNPICPYFDQCGGCEHQNISYQNQLIFKNEVFKETLKRAKVSKQPLELISGSSHNLFYRNSIRFFFVEKNNQIYFARHNYLYDEGFVFVDKCFLQSKTTNRILGELKNYINENIEHKGSFWQLKIREGKNTGQFMVEIITSDEHLPNQTGIANVLKNINGIKSVYHTIAPAKSLKNLRRRLIYGSPVIFEKIGKFTFQISPESFFQTNSLGVKTLYDKIKEFARVKAGDRVLDLFCGTGSIGIYLSTLAKEVIGVEVVPEAVRDARDNAKINHIHNCEFICADASDIKNWKLEIKNYDVVVMDPPRAGLTKELIHKLSTINHQRMVYVSCNPATFARDIKEFEKYNIELKKIQPIDMFPQTHHVECVGLLEKNKDLY